MSDMYSPNQQVVRGDGSGAAEEGSGGPSGPTPKAQPEPTPAAPAAPAVYDPGSFTVDEVKVYVTDHPDEQAAVLAAEQSGKNRVSLTEWLTVV